LLKIVQDIKRFSLFSKSFLFFIFHFLSNNYVCKCVWSIFIAFYLATFHTKCFSHKFSSRMQKMNLFPSWKRKGRKKILLHSVEWNGKAFLFWRFWEIYYIALLFSTWKLSSYLIVPLEMCRLCACFCACMYLQSLSYQENSLFFFFVVEKSLNNIRSCRRIRLVNLVDFRLEKDRLCLVSFTEDLLLLFIYFWKKVHYGKCIDFSSPSSFNVSIWRRY
jgi:hypothetical protein